MRHPMYQKQATFGEKAVRGIERAGQLYSAGKTVYEIGRGLYTAGTILAPMLL